MNYSKSIFALFLFAFFALTSCQKESMTELTTTPKAATERLSAPENTVNENVFTQLRLSEEKLKAQSRNKSITNIQPNGRTIYDSTVGATSTWDATNGACVKGLGDDFKGPDKLFMFQVKETQGVITTHQLTLGGMEDDLDLFVYTLKYGEMSACKGKSITYGLEDETLTMQNMAPGYYLVVVDGWNAFVESAFTLDLTYSVISETPPATSPTNVTIASFGLNGQKIGDFVQTETLAWTEFLTKGVTHDFVEVSRDADNVYLRDDSRGVNIRLDLNGQGIFYSDDKGASFYLYDIFSTSDRLNAYLAGASFYKNNVGTDGVFMITEFGDWIEYTNDAYDTQYLFSEVGRDTWSIYLRSDIRGVNIQLDLNRNKVIYSDDRGAKFDLYDITNSEIVTFF
ncbi:MAG: hypothetical protein AAF960_08700 [Bacteroidota bacterium]